MKIESGIPIPQRGDGLTALLRRMEIGDSIFIAGKRPQQVGTQISGAKPFRFTTRSVEGGIRVWRTE